MGIQLTRLIEPTKKDFNPTVEKKIDTELIVLENEEFVALKSFTNRVSAKKKKFNKIFHEKINKI